MPTSDPNVISIKIFIKKIYHGRVGIIFLKPMYFFIKFLIGGGLILICYAIKPFLFIRFGRIYTSRIGHLCYNVDNYISTRRIRDSKELAIFQRDKYISNFEIYKIWSEDKQIIFTLYSNIPRWFLEQFMPDSEFLISWNQELHPEYSYASLTQSNINLSKRIMKDIGGAISGGKIISPYICLHNRDSAYLQHYGGDGNHHDFRDFKFEDLRQTINQITEIGVTAVRLGEIVEAEYRTKNPRFVSMVGSKRSDLLDVYIIAECLFFVGCNTGFSIVPRLFRKPQLLINYIPFNMAELSAWSAGSLIVPKKIYSKTEKRYLRFFEMAVLPYDIHYRGDFFEENNLLVEENSPKEIADAVTEMFSRVMGTWKDTEVQCKLQDKFWISVADIKYSLDLRDAFGIKISSTFLEKNHFLI